MIDNILKYFPDLSDRQIQQLEAMTELYPEWNMKINVISRKDIDNLEINHILHSLAIAKFIKFQAGSRILDFGSGGGFPGIPLAMVFPDSHFHLVDRIGKKLKVAQSIADQIGLTNVSVQHGDIGECHEKFDFIVSRAVMPQPDLLKLSAKNISKENKNAYPNGIIALKGGDLNAELRPIRKITDIIPVNQYFSEPFFDKKQIIYTQA